MSGSGRSDWVWVGWVWAWVVRQSARVMASAGRERLMRAGRAMTSTISGEWAVVYGVEVGRSSQLEEMAGFEANKTIFYWLVVGTMGCGMGAIKVVAQSRRNGVECGRTTRPCRSAAEKETLVR